MPVAAEVVLNSLFRLAPSDIVDKLEPFAVAQRVDEREVASVVVAARVNLVKDKTGLWFKSLKTNTGSFPPSTEVPNTVIASNGEPSVLSPG